jgi:xanthine dehydrogenase small subunit
MEKNMSSQPIQFFHRGQVVSVSGAHTTRSVLDWLRENAHCSGTKEGCNEGDCGACTVVIGELADDVNDGNACGVGGLHLRSVNACIQFLPTLHGKALFTVEDLKSSDTQALHPVQQAMVECHGSQCGFCTPGFVMTLWSTYQRSQAAGTTPSRQALADELSGNLCRCTGYRPILDAGERMFDLPAVPLNTVPAVAALMSLKNDATFTYQAPNPQANGRIDHFHAPQSVAALAALRLEKPNAQLLAGCTDVGLWVNKQFRDLGDIIYLGDVAELKQITVANDVLFVGAGATLEAAWRALAQHSAALTDVWLRFASPLIRNVGTMGGNVANGSPIGDTAPVLMALDALIELRCGDAVRRMPLQDFYIDYMRNRLKPGEFVQSMAVPLSAFQKQVRAYKISKRFDCDISALCAGFSIAVQDNIVTHIRLAFGGMAGTVKRATAAEGTLLGKNWDQSAVAAAKAALLQDFEPLSDMRASAGYRMQVAQNLLQRFWLETRSSKPLSANEVSVWNDMTLARSAEVAQP